MSGCICGECHAEITPKQIIAAETRRPLVARESDPFPDLLGNCTVNFSTAWHRGGVLLSNEAAARCATPEEMNRAEAKVGAELLRHAKAGLRAPGSPVPEWASGFSLDSPPA